MPGPVILREYLPLLQVTLTQLDLSFNKISIIENLDALTRLEDLSLFHNNISVCENLEALASLKCLSLGEHNAS